MEINCTLLVQCSNFGIAYIIFSRLIFKPILESILDERAKREALQHAIIASQDMIKNLELKHASDWKYAQTQFRTSLRTIPYHHHEIPYRYQYEYAAPSEQQVDVQAKRIHDVIMKKVANEFK